ncbi:MAG TPA: magnesium chelatase domain-containing protein [Longimicrobiaceae bacterium]
MHARVLSGAVLGVDAYIVSVEADVANGVPNFSTVGLAQGAVREGKERVVAAIRNSGFLLPPRRITVNLAPADVRKEGSAFDLPIALSIIAATGQLSEDRLEQFALLGEVGLDGALRPVRGALPVALATREAGLRGLVLPGANVAEAAVVEGIEVRGADSLLQVARFLEDLEVLPVAPTTAADFVRDTAEDQVDFADVKGQEHV